MLVAGHTANVLGCEACHGPGAAHVKSEGDPQKIFAFRANAQKVSQACLQCHQYGEEHSNFLRSAHKTGSVSCLDCHAIHKAHEPRFLLVQKQPQLCISCHQQTRAEFAKPFRHRVNEGLVTCTDCHNQHGGFEPRLLRTAASQEQVCTRCHTEKAGPFVFEHAPLKTEGCTTCHAPHGSSSPRMLKRSNVNLLCLECHTFTPGLTARGTPPFHNQAQRFQACTLCHAAIHGSNFSQDFYR